MDLLAAIHARHSVRSYIDRPIEGEASDVLRLAVKKASEGSGLEFQLHLEEPDAFSCLLARLGKFRGVRNYIAAVGPKGGSRELSELCGYYGEQVVLMAQAVGLNTCWVGLTCRRRPEALGLSAGQRPYIVIAVGYGEDQGVPHVSRPRERVMKASGPVPEWFARGVDAALLAPTAMNQQKFLLELDGDRARATAGLGFYSSMDLGIVKRHFEIGSGRGRDVWLPSR